MTSDPPSVTPEDLADAVQCVKDAYTRRNELIVRASAEGYMTQQAIADAVGMRREQIRRIVRAAE